MAYRWLRASSGRGGSCGGGGDAGIGSGTAGGRSSRCWRGTNVTRGAQTQTEALRSRYDAIHRTCRSSRPVRGLLRRQDELSFTYFHLLSRNITITSNFFRFSTFVASSSKLTTLLLRLIPSKLWHSFCFFFFSNLLILLRSLILRFRFVLCCN